MNERILLVEHTSLLRGSLTRSLTQQGFAVQSEGDGRGACRAVDVSPGPQACVLALTLPDVEGRDFCLALRARGRGLPVLFLTEDSAAERIAAFGAGGDDCMARPPHPAELAARLHVLLRRVRADVANPLGRAVLDPVTHALVAEGTATSLSAIEFRVLAVLAAAAGNAVRGHELVEVAWARGAIVQPNTLHVYISRVRSRIAGLPGPPRLVTVRGVGYRLDPAP